MKSPIIIFFVKFVPSTKHPIPISPLQLFLFILRGLYFSNELFPLAFPLFYSITTIHILWDRPSSNQKFTTPRRLIKSNMIQSQLSSSIGIQSSGNRVSAYSSGKPSAPAA